MNKTLTGLKIGIPVLVSAHGPLSPGHTFTYAATDREGWSRIEKSRMKRAPRAQFWRDSMFPRWEYGKQGQSEGLIRETQGYTTVCRGATVNYHGTATDDDGASTDTHGRNSVSTETVRKHYGTVLVPRIALFTVIQGRPGRATFACTEAGGISRVALRLCRVALRLCRVALRMHYGLTIPWPRHGRATEVLNSSKHSWPLPDHHGSPGIMKDHDGLFQGLTTFHHGTWIRGDP